MDAAKHEHAVLLLWQRSERGPPTDDSDMQDLLEIPEATWSHLGQLMFDAAPHLVGAVIRVLDTMTCQLASSNSDAAAGALVRMFGGELKQCIVDKLLNCLHAHASEALNKNSRLIPPLLRALVRAHSPSTASERDVDVMVAMLAMASRLPTLDTALVASELLCSLVRTDYGEVIKSSIINAIDRTALLPELVDAACDAKTNRLGANEEAARTALDTCHVSLLVECVRCHSRVTSAVPVGKWVALCGTLAHSSDSTLQLHGVQLLHVLLRTSEAAEWRGARVVTTVRLSGHLLTLAWLLGHQDAQIATEVASIFEFVKSCSSPTDLLRALLEQGCVIVLSRVARSAASAQIAARAILQWVHQQLLAPLALSAFTSSITRASNALLQQNLLLSLLLLAHDSPAVYEALEEEAFANETVASVLQTADEDSDLVLNVLGAVIAWCDKTSLLRVDDGASFHRLSRVNRLNHKSSQSSLPPPPPPSQTGSNNDTTSVQLRLKCQDGIQIVDMQLLVRHSREARSAVAASSPGSCAVLQLEEFSSGVVHLLMTTLGKSQHQATSDLQEHTQHELRQLLLLAKRLECTKCWHAAAFVLGSQLDSTNSYDLFQLAVDARHPSLMLRAARASVEFRGAAVATQRRQIAVTFLQKLWTAAAPSNNDDSGNTSAVGSSQ